jgi:Na+-translocating ferredoxin:NAD+ oxidoreductase RnfG subunit
VRRALLVVALAVAGGSLALADRVYLKDSEVPKAMFASSGRATKQTLALSDDQLAALGKALGRKIEARSYPYFAIEDARGAPLGVIFVLDVIGQSLPITFAIAVAPDGAIHDLQVLVYRESHGDEITDRRFRRQFAGKRASDPIVLGKDIDAISGATISSRSATFAARKGLRLAELLRGGTR